MAEPRGKRQQEIWGLHQALPALPETKRKEIENMYVFLSLTKPSKKRHSEGWCSKCGCSFDAQELYMSGKTKAVCPICGVKAELKKDTRRLRVKFCWYSFDLKLVKGYQVIRGYQCFSYAKRYQERHVFIDEVFRIFTIPAHNKTYYLSKDVNGLMSGCFDNYRTHSKISFKSCSERFYVYGDVLSRPQVHPFLRKRGLNAKTIEWMDGISLSTLVRIANDQIAETILKIGDRSMVHLITTNDFYSFVRKWPSIKIALRHKYRVKDWKTYLDYLSHLERADKDLRNPHYICPLNLQEEEQKLIAEERRLYERREAERAERDRIAKIERERDMNDPNSKGNRAYRQRVAKYLDKSFVSGDIKIYTLQNIREFFQFGEALHHCVFSNEYYKKSGCLILGATVKGEIMECIEMDTNRMTIQQCRGRFNQDSPYHNQILSLAEKSLPQLRIAK